jgi:hypothetical protein
MTWANITEFPGYQASSDGEVRSFRRSKPRTLKPFLNPDTGYLQVCLRRDGKTYVKTVHVLVALAFIGPPPWNMEVCHQDRVKTNNSLLNLEYDTRSRNALDGWRARRASATAAAHATESDCKPRRRPSA